MRAAISLTCMLLPAGLAAQPAEVPGEPDEPAIARSRGANLGKLLLHVQRGDDAAFNNAIAPGARLRIDAIGAKSVAAVQPLSAETLRSSIGSCTQLSQVAVTTAPERYRIHHIYQCDTNELSGDVRAIFAFDKERLTDVRLAKVDYRKAAAGRHAVLNQSSSDDLFLGAYLTEHHARLNSIEALLDTMEDMDRSRFRAVGGSQIFYSSDPHRIFPAVVAPNAPRLTVDSLSGLRACKRGRPIETEADWYAVSWQCPAGNTAEPPRYLFKFAGRKLVAVQAARAVPKFKIN